MSELNPVYRALRGNQHYHVPQTAPIEAKFEKCRQAFERLCIIVRSISDDASDAAITDVNIVDDSYGSFLAWGNDSGASKRTLDHTLRKANNLSQMTLELLASLDENVNGGIDKIQETLVEDDLEIEEEHEEVEPVEQVGAHSHKSSNIPAIVEVLNEIIICLVRLTPTICDPFPIDTYSVDSLPTDARPDIDLATVLFPTATTRLIETLAWANSRRRKYLNSLEGKRRSGVAISGVNIRNLRRIKQSPQRDVAVDAFNFQKPGLNPPQSTPEKTHVESRYTLTASDAGSSSVHESVFSAKTRMTEFTLATTAAEIETGKQLFVPNPPVSLHASGAFLCPYCHEEIEVGQNLKSNEDWELHVFGDLEPYICTFDDCLRAGKTYGARDSWYRHELESHRIVKVWLCRSCALEFNSALAFEIHLKESHNGTWTQSQKSTMMTLCMKHSEKQLEEEQCPLCGLKVDAKALKGHLANHLEQFALTSINGDSTSEEDDSDEIKSQRTFDDTTSERRTKLEILNDFVEEQLNYVLPENQKPADTGLDRSNLDFLGDSDEEDQATEEGDEPQSIRKQGADTRRWKVSKYLMDKPENPSDFVKTPYIHGKTPKSQRLQIQRPATSTSSAIGTLALRTASHPREDDFVGRDGDLAKLYKILSITGRVCTISGTGGVGKTATATEYTYRYEQAYSYVFWVQAETRVGCADTFSLIAIALELASEGQDQKEQIELGREFLESTEKKWLLVFDNVDTWEEIEKYIPANMATTNGAILVTTRGPEVGPTPTPLNFFRVNLKEMGMEESRALLIQSMNPGMKHEKIRLHPEYKIAGDIASVAGLPLALAHIAGYVKVSGCTLAEFLELWNEWRTNTLSARPADPSSNATLETIWSIGLSELGTDALKLLKITAFFDSDGIQRELLINVHNSPSLAFLHSRGSARCRKMILDLTTRKLITSKQQDNREVFSVHRLLQHRLLQDLDDNVQDREEIFHLAFELIRERLPRPSMDGNDSVGWTAFREYLPHVLTLQRIFDSGTPILTPFVMLAELFRDSGVYLGQRGQIYDGLRLLNSAEAILDRLNCEEDQLRIDIHIATALLIQYFGISHRAESSRRFRKILEIRQKLAGQAQPGTISKAIEITTYNSRADYGNSLLQFNNYKDAEPIYQECHAKYQEWGGSEDEMYFEHAKFNHHMAYCRMYHHDFDEAIRLSSKAVDLISRHMGQPQLIMRYEFDLACIILQSGDIERALVMQDKILRKRLTLQGNGKASYFTLQSYYAVGAAHAHLKNWDQAEWYMRTALLKAQERADKSFWPEAAVARTEFHLSSALRNNGKDGVEPDTLVSKARLVLSRLLPFDPLNGVTEEDELALFDHLQPVFGGRFTGISLLKYVL